jgi:hypothetical protein
MSDRGNKTMSDENKAVKYHADMARDVCHIFSHSSTMSIGICPVTTAKNGKPKKGAAVVRVKGSPDESGVKYIDRMVAIVIGKLEAGCYNGPKTLNVYSLYAQNIFHRESQIGEKDG